MKMNLKARDWHNWVSVILLLPMLLVGLTAVFLAHKKELGLNELDVTAYVSWLPGYGDGALARGAPEVRAFLLAPDGRTYVGTQRGSTLHAWSPPLRPTVQRRWRGRGRLEIRRQLPSPRQW